MTPRVAISSSRPPLVAAGAGRHPASARPPTPTRPGATRSRSAWSAAAAEAPARRSSRSPTSSNVKLHAMGDLFKDHLDGCREKLAKQVRRQGRRHRRPLLHRLRRLQAGDRLGDVDLVILATPPGVPPGHIKAAIAAGKNLFCEKPVAVDGHRESGPSSSRRRGGQGRRSSPSSPEPSAATRRATSRIMKRIQATANIGDLVTARLLEPGRPLEGRPDSLDVRFRVSDSQLALLHLALGRPHLRAARPQPRRDELGDGQRHPVRCNVGMGGRQVRTAPIYGNIFDHFAVEYEYPGRDQDDPAMSPDRRTAPANVSETIVGYQGELRPSGWATAESGTWEASANTRYRFRMEHERNPYEQEHIDLIESIRSGKPAE